VNALAMLGSDLYAGGWFTKTGGNAANYIAKWNGSSWSALGSGMNNTVYALAVSGCDLYAGGAFNMAGANQADGIARWRACPVLRITRSGRNAVVSWPVATSGCMLQQTENLGANTLWTPVSRSVAQSANEYVVTVPATKPKQFFRLAPYSAGTLAYPRIDIDSPKPQAGAGFGSMVAPIGDVDGDGARLRRGSAGTKRKWNNGSGSGLYFQRRQSHIRAGN
jgi:hypothetical protein